MKIFPHFNTEVIKRLRTGQIGVIPTDTIYGIVTLLANKRAVERLMTIKNRPINKPVGTIIIADPKQIASFVDNTAIDLAKSYWPGASVILPVGNSFKYAHRGLDSLPFRIPKETSKELIELVEKTGPLATSSANNADAAPANTVEEAVEIFGEKVDFYVDGGDLSGHKASKIVKIEPDGSVTTIRA